MLLQLELNMSRCHSPNELIKSVLLHLVYKRSEISKDLGNNFLLIIILSLYHNSMIKYFVLDLHCPEMY